MAIEANHFGKIPFVWQTHMFGKTPEIAVAKIVEQVDPDNVLIQGWDGPWRATYNKEFGPNVTKKIVDLFGNYGVGVCLWGAAYGTRKIEDEARMAAQTANEVGAKMVAFDQEVTFEKLQTPYYTNVIKKLLAGNAAEIKLGMEKLAKIPDLAHRLNSAFRNASGALVYHCGWGWKDSLVKKTPWHPTEIIQEFFRLFDGGMPMAYAMSAVPGQAYRQVVESYRQWASVNPDNKDIIMALRGWHGDGTPLTSGVIKESYEATTDLRDAGENVVGAAFWHAHSLTTHVYPQALDAYNQLKPWTNVPEPERHARNFSEYGANVDNFARSTPEKIAQIIQETRNYDQELRKLGFNSELPPEFLFPLAIPLLNVISQSVSTPDGMLEATAEVEALHKGIQSRSFLMNSGHKKTIFEAVKDAVQVS